MPSEPEDSFTNSRLPLDADNKRRTDRTDQSRANRGGLARAVPDAVSEPRAGPALPGEECRVPPREGWSELERWVWQEVGAGRIADINQHLGKAADPRKPEEWGPERRLTPAFLEVILLHDPWRSAIPRQGVRIIGALFEEKVDLENAELQCQLWLDDCRFPADVSFRSMHAARFISLAGSEFAVALDLGLVDLGNHLNLIRAKVTGILNMNGASVGGSLLMSDGAEFAEVNLVAAKVEGQLDLDNAKVAGMLNMASASIGTDLFMRERAEFANVSLVGAKIEGSLSLIRAKVTGTLNMNSATIGGSLLMSENAHFSEVNLVAADVKGQLSLSNTKVTGTLDMNGASIGTDLFMSGNAKFANVSLIGTKIEGQLSLSGAKVTGTLNMDSASIGSHLFMCKGAKAEKGIDLSFATVGGNLDLRDTTFAYLDLIGTRIEGELRLASEGGRAKWAASAFLRLRNARVDAIQDEPGAWPARLDLDGFTYGRFGGFGADPARVIEERGSQWFVDWLARDQPYTPQPYEQCAKVLRDMGHPEMANDVLYAGRERERKEALRTGNNPRATGLALLKWFIGYGYGHRYFRSLWWVAALVLVGALLFAFTGEYSEIPGAIPWSTASWVDLVAYNFDILLPIINLHERYEEINLSEPVRYYFYFEKIMGYVLASFLIAGLSGLTK